MDWNKGFSSSYFFSKVDPISWRDNGEFNVTDGSIARDSSGDLLQSADVTMSSDPGEAWIRIYLLVRQNGEQLRIPLFTGLTSDPTRNIDGRRNTFDVACYSTLKPCSDILLPAGWYTPSGIAGAQMVKNLLKDTPANITCEDNSPALSTYIVAEQGETKLSMAQKILSAIGWEMIIDGNGDIFVRKVPTEFSVSFSSKYNDILELSASDKKDWFSCPNVLRVVNNDVSMTVRDDDPDSPLSTVSRGREIWVEERNAALTEGETLGHYAHRRLKELQSPVRNISYHRRFMPDIYPGDIIRLDYPENGLVGEYKIDSQNIQLTHGASTEETVHET